MKKTIRKLQIQNGQYIYDQKELLHQVKIYYTNVFKNQDKYLNAEISDHLKNITLPQITDSDLVHHIQLGEMNSILQKMKHSKTPGIDGITVEFLKIFRGSLKYYILNAINFCFEKGIMPPSLRQCIIVCLPKGNKDRTLLKNWRPISLLSVIYKLASSVIADRLKRNLDQIISKLQTGFVPGRHMSDCTRLIYDIMFHAERENKDGLLLSGPSGTLICFHRSSTDHRRRRRRIMVSLE